MPIKMKLMNGGNKKNNVGIYMARHSIGHKTHNWRKMGNKIMKGSSSFLKGAGKVAMIAGTATGNPGLASGGVIAHKAGQTIERVRRGRTDKIEPFLT